MGVKVIGIGGAGNNIVSHIGKITDCNCVAVNTDEKHLETINGNIQKIFLQFQKNVNGIITLSDECEKKLTAALVRNKKCFLIAGLGGVAGTFGIIQVAKVAKRKDIRTIGICVLPFAVEQKRVENTKKAFQKIMQSLDSLIVLKNDYLTMINPNAPMADAFNIMSTIIASIVKVMEKEALTGIYGEFVLKKENGAVEIKNIFKNELKTLGFDTENIYLKIYKKEEFENAVFHG